MATTSLSATKGKSATNSMNKLQAQLQQQQQQQQPGFSYILYLHREELRKRKSSFMRISHTKFQLTHELITKTVRNIHKCSPDDLQILSRETIFKKNLRRQIARMKHQQWMEMAKYHKQQQDKFQQRQQKLFQQQQSATKQHHNSLPQQQRQQQQVNAVQATEGIEISQ
ncbi:uncharacterized protein ACRADG_002108 [Cochliomyia hominivorax]